jgi:hypothetical protein
MSPREHAEEVAKEKDEEIEKLNDRIAELEQDVAWWSMVVVAACMWPAAAVLGVWTTWVFIAEELTQGALLKRYWWAIGLEIVLFLGGFGVFEWSKRVFQSPRLGSQPPQARKTKSC